MIAQDAYLARMRHTALLLTASALFAVVARAGCIVSPPPLPPPPLASPSLASPQAEGGIEPDAAPVDPAGWALLEGQATLTYDLYLEMSAQIAAVDGDGVELLDQVATPELVASVAEDLQLLRDGGSRIEGRPAVEAFGLLDDTGDRIVAHVCSDVSGVRVVDLADGTSHDAALGLSEVLVEFVMHEDGRMLVAGVTLVAEAERTCP